MSKTKGKVDLKKTETVKTIKKDVKDGEMVMLPENTNIVGFMYSCKPYKVKCSCGANDKDNCKGKYEDEDTESVLSNDPSQPHESERQESETEDSEGTEVSVEYSDDETEVTETTEHECPSQVVELPPILLCPLPSEGGECPQWKAYITPEAIQDYYAAYGSAAYGSAAYGSAAYSGMVYPQPQSSYVSKPQSVTRAGYVPADYSSTQCTCQH